MSGSPLLVYHEDQFYMIGLHWGRLKEVHDKTGGVLLSERTTT